MGQECEDNVSVVAREETVDCTLATAVKYTRMVTVIQLLLSNDIESETSPFRFSFFPCRVSLH